MEAGADAVELCTAFIYRGWNTAPMICEELAAAMAPSDDTEQPDVKPAAVN